LLATGLLLVAAALFFATQAIAARNFWLALLHAGAEAAVVGGLADWFAVTALFRHPLGLPIPRTAIVPKSKDRIGAGLGQFVERNFLTSEILAAKIAALAPARRLASWLASPENAGLLSSKITAALPYALRSLEDAEIRNFVARSFHDQLRDADLAPALGKAIALLTRSEQFDLLFDRGLDAASNILARNADWLYRRVAERSTWWIPKAIDRHIAEKIVTGIAQILAELKSPESASRAQLRAAIEERATLLVHSPSAHQRFDEMKQRFIEHPQMQAWLAAIWDELRRIVSDDLAAPQSRTEAGLATALLSLGRNLASDEAMQRRIDAGIEHLTLAVIPWRGEISGLIAEVVREWDARSFAARIELAIGSDLQYIRMTGTLVGACVGCLLFLTTHLLG
jgi:uncharacterized membrane-anchored protein YjiN (DUF445 family)